MSGKPTYEELEQRIRELERRDHENEQAEKKLLEISEPKRAAQAL